jgi:Domain of unknown function (DUF4129)
VSGRRGLAALLGVAAAMVLAAIGSNAQTAAPGVQFVAALQDAYDALPQGDTIAATDPALLRVRAPVELAATYAPSSPALAPITADLQHDPVDLTDVRLRLQTLIGALHLPPGSVAEDPRAARSALHDVYAQDSFRGLDSGGSSGSLLSRIGQGIVDALRWISDHTVGSIGLVPTLVLAGLVLAAIVTFVWLRLRANATRAPRGTPRAEPAPRGLDADAEWRSAEEAAARGEHRQAVRHAFRSALLSAAERGRLQVDASWTTAELLARARGDADLLAALAPAAASFDHAWYSGRPVGAADWEVARERCGAVRRLAARRGVAA